MKKALKWLFTVILVVIVVAVLAAVTKFYILSPKMRAAQDMKAPNTPEAIAKGKYLANNVMACMSCHSDVKDEPGEPVIPETLGRGRDFGDQPMLPGRIRARNLTPDPDTGLGKWTDGEIVRAMREGVSRDGRPLFPIMPYRTFGQYLSDDDALAIVAYLRSLQPIKHDPGLTQIKFPVSMFIRAVPQPVEKPAPPAPDNSDPAKRGAWLLKVASCSECHDSATPTMEKIPDKAYAGNNKFVIPGVGTVYTANITSDKATGIGAYSDEDILRAITEGKTKSGRDIYAMPWSVYRGMTDEDKKALLTAIRQIPAVNNPVSPPEFIKK
jgi:cytochrome c553